VADDDEDVDARCSGSPTWFAHATDEATYCAAALISPTSIAHPMRRPCGFDLADIVISGVRMVDRNAR